MARIPLHNLQLYSTGTAVLVYRYSTVLLYTCYHEKGEITEEQHLMVHHRLQHKPETALAKYTAPPETGSDVDSGSETEDLPEVDNDDVPVSTQDPEPTTTEPATTEDTPEST